MTDWDISLLFSPESDVFMLPDRLLPSCIRPCLDFFYLVLILWYTLCLITAYTLETTYW